MVDKMVLLPIVDRELRVAARRPGTYWMRCVAATVVLVVFLVVLANGNVALRQMGPQLLNAMGVLALGFSMLAGVFLTADCLAEEKRDGTMGLLFLTDLKGYDVVLGKLVASSLHSFFGLLAVFPILGLSLLMGGVTGGEFARLLLVFGVTLFFSLNVGMFVSAICREARQAFLATLLIILTLSGVLPTLYWLVTLLGVGAAFDPPFWPSAPVAYHRAFDSSYQLISGPQRYWMAVGTIAAMGVACMIVASLLLPRTWQQEKTPRAMKNASDGTLSGLPRKPGEPIVLGNPMFWLGVRDPKVRRQALRVLVFMVPVALFFWVAAIGSSHFREAFTACIFTAYATHVVLKFLIATEASRRMNEDRRSGALELLLVTKMEVAEILKGQRQALWQVFRPALLVLAVGNVGLILTTLTFSRHLQMRTDELKIFFVMFAGGLVVLFLDFFAISTVGMWRGLNARKHHQAVLGTIGQILLTPWLMIFFMVFIQQGFRTAGGVVIAVLVWLSVGAVVGVFSAVGARNKLEQHLRSVAAGETGKT
ncbi:ABC transporter permease [Pedosphaera parvula]|uniref:ABC-2 type transporter n=1 Tax=Pedosphaera parvula (strain Ellin514) TaxID=320771 RepID=B9XK87_PEDPL|nr:ABC transporter permease [Pedosphaera parvula]EEF59725.1 ABC-2 type transporter [Pedosphaera parvula Ellin514]